MNLNKYKLLATTCAMALGFVGGANTALAAQYEMDDLTNTITINATADVKNTVDVVVTDMKFENIGVTSDAVDTATMVMAPDGAITDDIAGGLGTGEAHIVSDDDQGSPATVALTTGLVNTKVFVYYSNLTNLVDAGGPKLIFSKVQDDLATAGSYDVTGPTQVVGVGTTDNAGALSWNIGGTISTENTASPYDTNAYAGTFDMDLTY